MTARPHDAHARIEGVGELFALRPGRIALTAALEPAIRVVGWVGYFLGRDRDATEAVVRGRLLGGAGPRWRIGRGVDFVGSARRFRLGRNVCLYGRTYLNANGPAGLLTIGFHSHVDQGCVLYGQGGLEIGAECAVAAGVIIYSQTNADQQRDGTPVTLQPTCYEAVVVGDGCWIGAGARIIPGVRIAAGVHIAAGAVVTKSVTEPSLVAGVPARVVRSL